MRSLVLNAVCALPLWLTPGVSVRHVRVNRWRVRALFILGREVMLEHQVVGHA